MLRKFAVFAALFVAIATVLALRWMRRAPSPLAQRLKAAGWRVYGAQWCGWTRKQLEVLGVNDIYVDCEKEACEGVDGYPTWKRGAEVVSGFKPAEALERMCGQAQDLADRLLAAGWRLYGAQWCGWTQKQLKELGAGPDHALYVDCEKEACEGVDGYPAWKRGNETQSGFKPKQALEAMAGGAQGGQQGGPQDGLAQRLRDKGWKLFGADWCGWTKRQVEELGGQEACKGIYVDCEKEACDGVNAFPTWRDGAGNEQSGFRDRAALQKMLE